MITCIFHMQTSKEKKGGERKNDVLKKKHNTY